MKKLGAVLVLGAVLALFASMFYVSIKTNKPQTGASSPVQTSGEPALSGQVSTTVGTLRMRRRHENDMDFSKYNPFYWQGRHAEFTIRDYTSQGRKRIEVEMRTEWPQSYIPTAGPDFSAVYTGDPMSPTEHLRSKFLYNIRMNHVRDFRVFSAVLDEGAFNASGGAMDRGKILTMEFRFFMDQNFQDWKNQKAANVHTLSSYYSEFVRIKIGEPGLKIDTPYKNNGEAVAERYAGGDTTTVTPRVEPWKGLQQLATNIEPAHAQAFYHGRTWFHTNFESGVHVGEDSDDKPSVFFEGDRAFRAGYQGSAFNAQSCTECHHNNGTQLLPEVGSFLSKEMVIRTADTRGDATARHPAFGSQVQPRGRTSEGTVKLTRYEESQESFTDGTMITLRKPIFEIGGPLSKEYLGTSPRRVLPIVGMGLLEAIPESQVRAWAAANGGTLSVRDGTIGRFGWKAERISVKEQIQSAINTDLAVRTQLSNMWDCTNGCSTGKGQLFDPAINDLTTYVSLLGVPPRMTPEDPQVKRGYLVFAKLGCVSCHIPSTTTGNHAFKELSNQPIQPFTDLLLHDMGPGLQDNIPNTLQKKWRTTPLWSMKNVKHATDSRVGQFRPGDISILWQTAWNVANSNQTCFLHDCRAKTLEEAILWHGGEAEDEKQNYRRLPRAEREDLNRFLWDL